MQLFLAHIIGDFCLQPSIWVKDKEIKKHKSSKLYLHIGVHGITLAVLLGFNITYWLGFIVIIISHFFIDLIKINLTKKLNSKVLFYSDQLLHLIIITAVAYSYKPFTISYNMLSTTNILFIICLLLASYVSSVIIKITLSTWTPHTEEKEDESLAKAGRFIGILERLFVFIFIVTKHWEGIGFLLAAKSIFRFGDLKESKDRKLTEYILIGTLLSFGTAILIGLIFEYLKVLLNN